MQFEICWWFGKYQYMKNQIQIEDSLKNGLNDITLDEIKWYIDSFQKPKYQQLAEIYYANHIQFISPNEPLTRYGIIRVLD